VVPGKLVCQISTRLWIREFAECWEDLESFAETRRLTDGCELWSRLPTMVTRSARRSKPETTVGSRSSWTLARIEQAAPCPLASGLMCIRNRLTLWLVISWVRRTNYPSILSLLDRFLQTKVHNTHNLPIWVTVSIASWVIDETLLDADAVSCCLDHRKWRTTTSEAAAHLISNMCTTSWVSRF
jgi:hypothetical protein